MRVEWDLDGFDLDLPSSPRRSRPIAAELDMDWRLSLSSVKPRLAIFVSKYDHCLADLLYRHQTGELSCDIPLIVGNHPDAQWLAEFYKVPFHHIPVTTDNKAEAEAKQLALLDAPPHRPRRAGPLHAGAVAGVRRRTTRSGSSTSTTRSCRRSSGRSRTTGPSSAA